MTQRTDNPASGVPSERWMLLLAERESMMRVARARCANRMDAEDLVQEAFLRAAAMSEVHPTSVGALLRTIVSNMAADQARRVRTRERYSARLQAEERPLGSVDEQACDHDEARWLHTLCSSLPERDREVLLHRAAGHTVASAAARLGLTYKAAESSYTRARRQLRVAWQATLAAVGGFVASPRALRRLAPRAVIVATAAAALEITVVQCLPPPSTTPSSPVLMPTRAWSPHRLSTGINTATSRVAPGVTGTTPAAVHPQKRRDFYTGTIGNRRLVQTGIGVGSSDEDESLVETVERCMKYGLVVSPTVIDCNHAPRSSA